MPNLRKGPTLPSLSHAAILTFVLAHTFGQTLANEADTNDLPPTAKPVAVVHVGPRKTGSSAIQSSLKKYGESLDDDNYVVPVPLADAILACLTKDTKDGKCKGQRLEEATRQIRKARRRGENIIYSCEGLDKLKTAGQFDALDHLMDGFDVRIVAVYRRFFDWVASAYGQKYRCFDAWNSWSFRGKEGANREPLRGIAEWISRVPRRVDNLFRNHYSTSVYQRYSERYNVTLLNMYANKGDVVENFFCDSGALHAPTACEAKRTLHVPPSRSNRAEHLEYDEIAMAAADKGILDKRRISRLDARAAIRKRHENDLGKTLNDFQRNCPSDRVLDRLINLTIESEREYLPTYFKTVAENEDGELRSLFEASKVAKFCSVDTELVLSDSSWVDFLKELSIRADDIERN